jgi:anti-sigma regulatory factor (Ser/Thr protein kinase)
LLESRVDSARLADALLAVDELVTNSVRHAGVGPDQSIGIEILVFADRLRLCVVDPGSTGTPHVTDRAPDEPGGLGLVVVDRLSTGWGVARDGTGVTRTWCDLVLDAAP